MNSREVAAKTMVEGRANSNCIVSEGLAYVELYWGLQMFISGMPDYLGLQVPATEWPELTQANFVGIDGKQSECCVP